MRDLVMRKDSYEDGNIPLAVGRKGKVLSTTESYYRRTCTESTGPAADARRERQREQKKCVPIHSIVLYTYVPPSCSKKNSSLVRPRHGRGALV
jgi:hypothetical protein